MKREEKAKEKGVAMFQLQGQLERLHVSHPNDFETPASTSKDGLESAEVLEGAEDKRLQEIEEVCDEKAEEGNVKITARFARCWTHNEQLIIRPCEIILARATCYGSEAINAVKVEAFTRFLVLLVH